MEDTTVITNPLFDAETEELHSYLIELLDPTEDDCFDENADTFEWVKVPTL